MSPYRESNDRPLGEGWLQWAARWILRGAIGVTWSAAVIGGAGGAVFGAVYGILYLWSHTDTHVCNDSVTVIGSSVTCDSDQRLRLQIDPTDKDRTLAICECIRKNAAPSGSVTP